MAFASEVGERCAGGDQAAAAPRFAQRWCVAGSIAGVAVVAALLFAFGSRDFALTEPDEARYAEIAREMLARHDWVTPHLNFVKYFEKPPLVYWATALSFLLFGTSEWAARLPSQLSAVGTLLLCAWLAARCYGGPTALLAGAILAFGPLFGFLAVVLTLDMALTFFITASLTAFWCACEVGVGEPRARRFVALGFAAAACAVLVKGPVGVVLVGGAVLSLVVTPDGWRRLRLLLDWRAMALALAIIAPWFASVSWRNPEFWHFFIVDQHVNRYLASREHGAPAWFYLPIVVAALFPWVASLILDPLPLRRAADVRTWTPATRFLVTWAAVVVVFFSLSSSKLVTYVLPALPPLAILCARALLWVTDQHHTAGLGRLAWLLFVAAAGLAVGGAGMPLFSAHVRAHAVAPYLLAAAAPLAATGVALRRWAATRPRRALAALGIGWAFALGIAISGRGVANEYRALGVAARSTMRPDDRLAFYRKHVQSVVFYSQRRVVMIGTRGELNFGSRQGDQSAWFWPGDEDLVREWAGPGRLFVLFNRPDLERLRPRLDPSPCEVAAQGKKVLVVNRE